MRSLWFQELFKTSLSSAMPGFIRKVIMKKSSSPADFKGQITTHFEMLILGGCVCLFLCVQCLLESDSTSQVNQPVLRVWSSSVPYLKTSTSGTRVWAQASGELDCGSQGTLFFKTVQCHCVMGHFNILPSQLFSVHLRHLFLQSATSLSIFCLHLHLSQLLTSNHLWDTWTKVGITHSCQETFSSMSKVQRPVILYVIT